MNEIYTPRQTIILQDETPTTNVVGVSDSHKSQDFGSLLKEICEVPYSNEVDYATFSRILNDVAASYKMYWLLSLLDKVSIGHTEIKFRKLISKMVVYAWYPLLKIEEIIELDNELDFKPIVQDIDLFKNKERWYSYIVLNLKIYKS